MFKIKVLLTDLDGTLIHSVEPICDALHQCFISVGIVPPAKSAIIEMFGLPVEVMLTTLTSVEKSNRQVIDRFIEEYKIQYPLHMVNAKLIKGAKETLQQLFNQGVSICLITSERKQNAVHILNALGLNKYIKNIVSRDDVEHFKPHPEPILKAVALMNTDISSCAYIGESPFDIEAGVASGVFTIGVPSGNWSQQSLEKCKPDIMIEQISDVLQVLLSDTGGNVH